jgi:hypothetical protein
VQKAEFLKMLLLAHKMDPSIYDDIKLPLAPDVQSVTTWYYPYLRLAYASSIATVGKSGQLFPGKQLTRADVALFIDRLLLYKQGKREQELLTLAETDLLTTINSINSKDMTSAEYGSARALLAARGAAVSLPNEPIVKAALKIAQSYRSLVRGYRALLNGQFSDAIRLSKDSWSIAKDAADLNASVRNMTAEIQKSAGALAANARARRKS